MNDEILKDQIQIKKSIKKVRMHFMLRIILVTTLTIYIVLLLVPSVMSKIVLGKVSTYERMISNLTQFQTPVESVGFTSTIGLFDYNIGTITSRYKGFGITENQLSVQSISEYKISFPALKINFYNIYDNTFVSKVSDEVTNSINKILENNPHMVGIVNFSLKKPIAIADIMNIVKNEDVKVTWLAVLTGNEYETDDTIRFGDAYIQSRQFGFPTEIRNIGKTTTTKMDFENPEEYLNGIKTEWKWCLDNKNLINNPDKLLVFKDISMSLDSDIKIYGITVVGTTSSLINISNKENIVFGDVIGLYPWDWGGGKLAPEVNGIR